MSSEQLRAALVDALETGGWLRSPRVREAFLDTPRELFLPEHAERDGLDAIYRDEPIVTKRSRHGMPLSSSSQPAIMALMLEQLELAEGMRVLEIGAGTGYNAALLGRLVGSSGSVTTVDVDDELATHARAALRAAGGAARVVAGDGRDGVADRAPYDRIVVTASADAIPRAWFDQLAGDGRLQVPIRLADGGAQAIALLRKAGRGLRSVSAIAGGFMPLREPDGGAAAVAMPSALVAAHRDGRRETSIRELRGEAIATLSDRAKRRLLHVALGDARRVPLGLRARAAALTLFLSLTVPARHRVATAPRFGVGVIARDGTSLALIEPAFERRDSTVSSLRAFGDAQAERLLRGYVADWDARARPGAEDLTISVRYDDATAASTIRHRWPSRAT
ncbi:MAG: protein-L-isoaspartate(D-aspartate) O-methyltransferase [Solirubrobacteraceae bacterium]|nr:protein-L-isoaspartate(D-aspartate) O-methyltransferase [Solirubrobacteraceae bacterium]